LISLQNQDPDMYEPESFSEDDSQDQKLEDKQLSNKID